jgi:hypothetical protein
MPPTYQWRREDYNRTAKLEEFLPWLLSRQELEDFAANYKRVAGFQVEGLNAKPPIVVLPMQGGLSNAG